MNKIDCFQKLMELCSNNFNTVSSITQNCLKMELNEFENSIKQIWKIKFSKQDIFEEKLDSLLYYSEIYWKLHHN